ncbi:MAG: type II secretion system F family protein [Dehalococcoidia bacterium]
MPALTALAVFLFMTTLVLGLSGRRSMARASIAHRLQRARGGEQSVQLTGTMPTMRRSPFAKGGGFGRALSGVHSMQQIGQQIEHAGWRLSVVEFLAIDATVGAIAGFLVWTHFPSFVLLGGVLGLVLPLFILRRAVSKRRKKFIMQLIDALALISNAIKAGVGLMQALDQAAEQLKPPFSDEIRRTLHDINMGGSPDDAFAALNERLSSDDLDIVITAINVQRSTGGNLAEILDQVASTMRDRVRIRGEIKTLTTQQQFSGYMIAAMPIGLLLMFNMMNHTYVMPLFTTSTGNIMLAFGGILQGIGIFIIRKIVNIEV